MATHSSILAWRIPWTEEPDWLQSTGSQITGHDLATEHACTCVHVRAHTHTHTQDCFSYLDFFLSFHTNFRIVFSSISVKNAIRILIEPALNQYIALVIMDSLALLTFTIHKN